jgi:hypothetical protein
MASIMLIRGCIEHSTSFFTKDVLFDVITFLVCENLTAGRAGKLVRLTATFHLRHRIMREIAGIAARSSS